MGTYTGLVRFDGVQTTPWAPPSAAALPSSRVASLLVARDGSLWIGTFGGLASWNSHELKQYRELAGLFVNALAEDHQGTVWAGGFAYGGSGKLCAIRRDQVRCSANDGRIGEGVVALYVDSQGTLWAGTLSGFWRWAPGPPRFYAVSDENGAECFSEDDTQSLLIPLSARVVRLHEGKLEAAFAYPGGAPRLGVCQVLRDKDGAYWIATLKGVIRAYGGKAESYAEVDGLTRNAVNALFEDREGSIWVGTTGGLDLFAGGSVRTFSERNGIGAGLDPSVVAAKDGSAWYAGGGCLLRLRNGEIERYRGREAARADAAHDRYPYTAEVTISALPNFQFAKLFEDSHERLWMVTADRVGYLDHNRFIVIPGAPGGAVYWMASDAAGGLWISMYKEGLLHVSTVGMMETLPWTAIGRGEVATAGAIRPGDGTLWLGFPTGKIEVLIEGKIRVSYDASNGLPPGRVNDLRFDDDGVLWAATDGGLARLTQGHNTTLSMKSGLPCDRLFWTLQAPDRSLWLYSSCGLIRIEDRELQAWATGAIRTVRTTLLDVSDYVSLVGDLGGAPGPHGILSADGKLWFATSEGLSVVDPEHLALNSVPPPVHIERIIADGRTYAVSAPLRLPPLVRDLTIDYTALSFITPEKMHFRYRLEGQDSTGREVINERLVQYSNLKPGHYRFRVTASNASGIWNEHGDAFDFSIAPAFWQTWWFRATCGVVLAAFVYLLYLLRVRQLARAFALTLDARIAERTRIARDLHDTMLQNFQGVLLQLRAGLRFLESEPGKAREVLTSAIDQAVQSITSGREAVQGLRASAEESNDLAEAIGRLGKELAAAHSSSEAPSVQVAVEGTIRNLHPIVRDEVFRVAVEALRNVFQHSHATRVEVELWYDAREFRLRVRDDGQGIDPQILAGAGRQGHFGLRGMRERAKLAGGKLALWSAPDSGTEVELLIPGSAAYTASRSATE